MSGYTIIDADTHVTETPDVWTNRAPAHMRNRVPRIETNAKGIQRWVLGDTQGILANPGMTATAGRGTFKNPPKSYEEMHPGAYDPRARLKYMDEMGIWAMVMYPNVGGFGAQQFLKLSDPELMLACVRIYNDWQTEGLADCEESVRHKILWENAQKLYKVMAPSAADESKRANGTGA
jgi:uncharacterized protein